MGRQCMEGGGGGLRLGVVIRTEERSKERGGGSEVTGGWRVHNMRRKDIIRKRRTNSYVWRSRQPEPCKGETSFPEIAISPGRWECEPQNIGYRISNVEGR